MTTWYVYVIVELLELYLFEADIVMTKADMRLLLLQQRKAPNDADWHPLSPNGTGRVGDGERGGHDETLDLDIVEEGFLPLNDQISLPVSEVSATIPQSRGVNPWGLGCHDPQIWVVGVMGSPGNIIISYNVKKLWHESTSKVVTLEKFTDLQICV